MTNVRAHFRVTFYGELPEDDGEADEAFDRMGDEILAVLNRQTFAGIVAESFSITDGDTEPDE